MTEIVTWNIQCGLGIDGRIDLRRIADVIKSMGDPDAVCLQEVSRHMPPFDQDADADQPEALSALFPDHEPFFGPAVDRLDCANGTRQQFGNLILARLPVLSAFMHPLPQPAQEGLRHMPRQATEVTLQTRAGPLRLVTTHLEYHSVVQRSAQIAHLRALQVQASANIRLPPETAAGSAYEPMARPDDCVICGDFNFEPDGPEYGALTADFADAHPAPKLVDAWRHAHGTRPHDPTCGIYDRNQWPDGSHCRDFFFVTEPVAARIKESRVETVTDASDHQPALLTLAD